MTEIIENTGSIARDHLANERTYLAWLRTGVTLMGVGVALVKFDVIISGFLFTGVGVFFIFVSLYRYIQVKNALIDNKYIINTECLILLTIVTITIILLAFGVILYEKQK